MYTNVLLILLIKEHRKCIIMHYYTFCYTQDNYIYMNRVATCNVISF